MGWWSAQVVPRITDVALGTAEVAALRRAAVADATGVVVEIGFGSGANLPLYPDTVTRVLAVEPSPLARRLAASRTAASPVPVEHVGLDGARLPMDARVADTVVSTFTLCTIDDLDAALVEVRRVLRPGGRFLFLEHGLAPEPGVARWQRRLTPLQQRLFAGCRLDRAIDDRVRAAGLTITTLEHDRLRGPRLTSFLYRGVAT